MAEVPSFALDEAQLYSLAKMAAAAAVSQNTTTFGGKSKDSLLVGSNTGYMSIIHGPGEETVRKRHEEEMLAEERKAQKEKTALEQRALQSLAFPEMNQRENDIDTEPAPETCAWILEHETYTTWLSDRKGLLWIQGKAGAGKTTLLKYALQESKESTNPDKVMVASHFFEGRGVPIQKSPIGIYRSLLFQILSHFPKLLSEFSGIYKRKVETEGKASQKWEWKVAEMRKHLTFFLTRASQMKHIRIYVDALDEAGEQATRDMVQYFRRLTSQDPHTEHSVSICFSCRSYPLQYVEGSLTICVEDENYKDIVKVVENALSEFPAEQAKELAATIVDRAAGVFQWVVLVVPKLLKLYRQGENMKAITTELLEIPPELEHFYQEILESVPQKDLPRSLQLMQWLCFSRRPLKIEELRWAMVVDANCSYNSLSECESSMDWADTDNTMENRLNYLSGGLAGVVWAELADSEEEEGDNEVSGNERSIENGSWGPESSAPAEVGSATKPAGKKIRRFAQFVHQSVKDYLISSGLEKLDNYAKRSVVGRGHHSLSRACIKYISMQEVLSFANELDNRQVTGSNLSVIGNGTEARGNGQSQAGTPDCMDNGGQGKSAESNAQIQNGVPPPNQHLRTGNLDHSTERQTEKPTEASLGPISSDMDEDPEAELLRIASAQYRDHMRILESGGESSKMGASRGQALAATSYPGSSWQPDNQQPDVHGISNMAETTPSANASQEIEIYRGQDIQNPFHDGFADSFSDTDDESPTRGISGHLGRRHVMTESERRSRAKQKAERAFPFLEYALRFCLIHALLAEEEGIPQDILVELLETPKPARKGASPYQGRRGGGVSLNTTSHQMITPWRCIFKLMNVIIFDERSLLPANTTLLHIASKYGLKSVVAELLNPANNIDADPKDADGWTPLFYAAQQGHATIAQLLLQTGKVDADWRGHDSWTPLSLSAACQSEDVMQILLETAKVEVDRRDESGRTALFWAARFGTEAAVQRLLDTGKVDVNLKEKDGHSLLSWATEELYHPMVKLPAGNNRFQRKEELTAIIQLLLRSGKIYLGKDEEGQTLLSIAAMNGHDLLVQQLLKTGKVDVDSRDFSSGRTPLSLAAYNGHVSVVKRLLKTGRVDVNSTDHMGRTPLSLALSYLAYINTLKPQGDEDEHEHEIRMLLATRKLNIKQKDMDLWTSRLTSYSLERDHLAVAKLLLDTGEIHEGPGNQWVQPPSEWLAIIGTEEEDLKAAQSASLARREKEKREQNDLEAAIAASLAKKEQEDQERAEFEAAISVSLLKADDEEAILEAIMAMSLEDSNNMTRELGRRNQVDYTDSDNFFSDDDVELELAKAMSLAENVEKPELPTRKSARVSSQGNSSPRVEAQQQVDRPSRLESRLASASAPHSPGRKPKPKPKPEHLTQASTERLSKPTPQPKPEHLTPPSPEPKSKTPQSPRISPEPKPKPKHLGVQ